MLIPISIYGGVFHLKKSGAYAADASLATEQNPYIYKAVPGKEEEVFIPLWMLTAKALAKMLDQQSNISPEDKKQFEEAIQKAEKLMTGGAVGA